MPDFLQIAQEIDVDALRLAIESNPQLFGRHNARAAAYGSPHAEMTDIWVRYNDIANIGPRFNDAHDSVWYPAYCALPEIKPIIFGLMKFVSGERLGGVLITKLPPGGKIATHVDRNWHADYYEKFYIPIKNEPGAVFRFPSGDICPRQGDVYWFDNAVPHSVANDSDQDRIALVVCIKTSEYSRENQ